MNIKVGTDIVSINRIENSINRFGNKFLERFLTQNEIKRVKSIESIAGLWAAKEAIAKALETGIGKELNFKDIEILKKNNNVPYFRLKNNKFNIINSSISISHDKGFAIAVAIVIL